MEKSDLAARHAKRIDLCRADQVDFPLPVFGAGVPLVAEGNQLLRDRTQAEHFGMVIRCECVFVLGLLEELRILLGGRAFDLGGGNQLGEARGVANLYAFARQQGSR